MPGEIIPFQAEIDNKANQDIQGSLLQLIEHATYITSSKKKKESCIVAQWNRGIIHPGDTDLWTGMTMKVPAGRSHLFIFDIHIHVFK